MKLTLAIALQISALFFAWMNSPLTLVLAGMCGLGVIWLRVKPSPRYGEPLSYDPRNVPTGHPYGEL